MNNRTIDIKKKEVEESLVDFLDHYCDRYLSGFKITNTASLRRVMFFRYFLTNKGNATRAAILAGYSPRSAKQQGHRVLKWVQNEIAKDGQQN